MRLHTVVLLLLPAVLVLHQAAGISALQEQIIRSRVRMIAVDVRVFDSQDRFVNDLSHDDFEIFEDGVRQDVQVLYRVTEPPGLPCTRNVEPLKTPANAAASDVSAPRARQTWIFFFDENGNSDR